MIGVLIHVEDRWNYTQSDRDMEIMQMFASTAKILGSEVLLVVDKTTNGLIYDHGDKEMKMEVYKSLDEALVAYPKITKVFFEQEQLIPTKYNDNKCRFKDLQHPKNVIYIFGGDEAGLNFTNIKIRRKDIMAYIDFTPFSLWQISMISLVLYDRMIKAK